MSQNKNTFRHDSLQNQETIQALLKSIGKGLEKGRLTFSDAEGEIVLKPEGLLNLKISASREGAHHRLSLRVSWQSEPSPVKDKKLKVGC